jgi:hypothetical protein
MTPARLPSLAMDISDDITKHHLETPRSALAFAIELEGQKSPIPKGVEKRLAERSKPVKFRSKEEIDQKLILAERRRLVPLFFSNDEIWNEFRRRVCALHYLFHQVWGGQNALPDHEVRGPK